MYVNPFWFGFALGAIAGIVVLLIVAIIYSRRGK